jgi:hypothetical protein
MKPSIWFTLLFLAIITPYIQDRPGSVCRLETRYDNSTDTTTVRCDLVELRDAPARLTIQAVASYRGKESNETVKFWLDLSRFISGATINTKSVFQEVKAISLLSDKIRLEIPVSDYHNDFFELNRLLAESAEAEIGREDLRKLLDSNSLKAKWGDVEIEFSDIHLKSLKTFISRQVFLAETR